MSGHYPAGVTNADIERLAEADYRCDRPTSEWTDADWRWAWSQPQEHARVARILAERAGAQR